VKVTVSVPPSPALVVNRVVYEALSVDVWIW
jgi:hypothetical protein